MASTLHLPADTAGALVDPNAIHTSLIESIIEVDEEVMTRYFEGSQPTDEEIGRLIVQAVAGRNADPDRLLLGQDRRGRARNCSTPWPSAACRQDAVHRTAKNAPETRWSR